MKLPQQKDFIRYTEAMHKTVLREFVYYWAYNPKFRNKAVKLVTEFGLAYSLKDKREMNHLIEYTRLLLGICRNQ